MKNIAILCDGTWQNFGQPYPTNVAKIARAIGPRNADGGAQIVYYDDGVGVSQGVLDAATHLVGGALGAGLDYKIGRAYEFLCLNYEPGDRLYIFGFSRGAYTARSLVGLLRWAWILRRDHISDVFAATALYRSRPPKGSDHALEDAFEARAAQFRSDHSYPAAPFVDGKNYDPADPASLAAGDECAWVQFLGVWDTVGALGFPSVLPFADTLNARYGFYDTNLSRFVRSARHAVSIDERRKAFEPTLWDNIAAQNTHAGADQLAYGKRPYQQVWFPGNHGSVGGGGDDGGLSLIPMLWMAEGATRAGLVFDRAALADYAAIAHPDSKVTHAFSLGQFIIELEGVSDRVGPAAPEEVSLSACLRWSRLGAAYHPAPLTRVQGVVDYLNAWPPPPDPQAWYAP